MPVVGHRQLQLNTSGSFEAEPGTWNHQISMHVLALRGNEMWALIRHVFR